MKAIITIHTSTPIDCTAEQLTEWLRYELSISEDIDINNPLQGYTFDPVDGDDPTGNLSVQIGEESVHVVKPLVDLQDWALILDKIPPTYQADFLTYILSRIKRAAIVEGVDNYQNQTK